MREISDTLVAFHPLAGLHFDPANELADGDRPAQFDQRVHVVGDATNLLRGWQPNASSPPAR